MRQYLSADLVDMQLLSKFKKRIRFLFCAIDIYSKYAWVVSLKVVNFTIDQMKS